MDSNELLAANLRAAMHSQALTNEELARLSGVAARTIQNYRSPNSRKASEEGGRGAGARLSHIEAIARALGLPVWQLLAEPHEGLMDPARPAGYRRGMLVLEYLRQIPDEALAREAEHRAVRTIIDLLLLPRADAVDIPPASPPKSPLKAREDKPL